MSDLYITVVSGLPRSGTSLMMQMLEAGGMPLLTDGRRLADEHNPRGYFEYEAVKASRTDLSWLEQAAGKAVKVIHLLLPHLPADRNYRVLFMLRNLEEVIRSQRVMLMQQGRPAAALDDRALAVVFENQLATVREWLAQRTNFCLCYLNYSEVIARPMAAAEEINRFLGGNLRVADMAAVVIPTLYRQRKSGPVKSA